MKRKSLLLILILFTSGICFSYNMEEFYQLPPEEQIDLWIKEFSYRESLLGKSSYATEVYFSKPENIPIYAPLIIEKLKATDLDIYYKPRASETFKMLDSTLMEMCTNLSKEVRKEIAEIYKEKIYGHILKYGTIDWSVYTVTSHVVYFEEGVEPSPYGFNPYELKAMYEAEGIENVIIDWKDLNRDEKFRQKEFSPSDKTEFFKGTLKDYCPTDKTLLGSKGQCGGTVFYTEDDRFWEYIDLDIENTNIFINSSLELYFTGKDKGGIYKEITCFSKIKREDKDWRLPTPTELNWIYKYLVETGAERPDKWYWSSETTDRRDYVYVQRFSDGNFSNNNHVRKCSIILVRTYETD